MARVFVSHAGSDSGLAGELHDWLVSEGHELFLDRDLRTGLATGDEWELRLYERLRWADAVVCLVSAAFRASEWCTAEVAIAKSRGSRLLPLRIDSIDHPLLPSSQFQFGDYSGDPEAAKESLREALRRIDLAGGWGWSDDRSPFPGLQPYDTDLHRAFFGRREEAAALAELLRVPTASADRGLVVVVGPSGCGKSSLVRAGLLPMMAEEPGWLALYPFFPGREPLAGLARELTAAARQVDLDWTLSGVRQRLENKGGLELLADELLLAASKGQRRRQLLVVVDQLEEALTQASASSRRAFAAQLNEALEGSVRVVATIRLDSLDQLLGDSELTLPVRTFTLRPLDQGALRMVVEGPANLAGIGVDDSLVSRLVTDTGSGEGLPLLAFTLAQLATGLRRGDRLSMKRYEELGGVRGALQRQAEEALTSASQTTGRTKDEVVQGLLELVTVDEKGEPRRWRMRRDELPPMVRTEMDAFVARRLLVTDMDDGGHAIVAVAHEAFLSAWPPLAAAIATAAAGLRARRDIEHAAIEWERTGRTSQSLWESNQLAAALSATGARLQWTARKSRRPGGAADAPASPQMSSTWFPNATRVLTTQHVHLSSVGRTFLQSSVTRDRGRRRRASTILSVLLALAVVAASIALVQRQNALAQQQQATTQHQLAVATELTTEAEALRDSQPRVSLMLGVEALKLKPSASARMGLVTTLLGTRYAGIIRGHTDGVTAIAISPDGRTLATASFDDTVILWDLSKGIHPARLATLTAQKDTIWDVAFSPDNKVLATASADKTVVLWDVTDRSHPASLSTLTGHTDAVFGVALSPDGRTLATGSADKTAILWDITNRSHPVQLSKLTAHTGAVHRLAFSPDGRILATASQDSTVILWEVSKPSTPARLDTLNAGGQLDGVAFSPDGHMLAAGGTDQTVILWDVADSHRVTQQAKITGFTDTVSDVAFSPNGKTLATADADHTAVLWDVTDSSHPSRAWTLSGHMDWVSAVAFNPDGKTLVTGSRDGTAILWLTSPRSVPNMLSNIGPNDAFAITVAISPDGRTLVTGNADGTSDLWDITEATQPLHLANLAGQSDYVYGVAFSPDGRTLAAATGDKSVILWNVSDRGKPIRLATLSGDSGTVFSVAFSPDGRTLATGSGDNTVLLWDVSDPTHPNRLAVLTNHTNAVYQVAFSPDRRTLIAGSRDGTAILWDVHNPAHPVGLAVLDGGQNPVLSVAISPDGQTAAMGSTGGTAILWDIHDRVHPVRIATMSDLGASVYALAFDQRGTILVTGSGDPLQTVSSSGALLAPSNAATLWDISDRSKPIRAAGLGSHGNTVLAVAMNEDAGVLALASVDGTTSLWDLRGFQSFVANALGTACNIAGPTLSRDEWIQYRPDATYEPICSQPFAVGDQCAVGSWLLRDETSQYSDQNGNQINLKGGVGAQLLVSPDGTAIYTYDQPNGKGSVYTATGPDFSDVATETGSSTSQILAQPPSTWNETIESNNVMETDIVNGQAPTTTSSAIVAATSYSCSHSQLVLRVSKDTQTWTRAT
jgi:WD40 repeat protein